MEPRTEQRNLGMCGSTGFLVSIGSIVIAAGVGLAFLRVFATSPGLRGIEDALAGVALGGVVAVPGILTLLARAGRSTLLLPAATMLIPLSFGSFAGVLLPLLILAAMMFVAYGRRSAGHATSDGRTALTTLAVIGLLLAAVAALLVHQDPRSYTTATGGRWTSDVVTITESLISLSLSAAAVGTGWLLAPRDRDERPPTT